MWTRTIALLLSVTAGVAAAGAAGGRASFAGTWTGTYTQVRSTPFTMTVEGRRVEMALGPGHATLQTVTATISGSRLRVAIPGRPTPLQLTLRLAVDGRLTGTATQAGVRGPAAARRGGDAELMARGAFAAGTDELDVVDDPYGPPRLLDPATGVVRGLFAAGTGFTIGSGFATERPSQGTARIDEHKTTIAGRALGRVTRLELEVRISTQGATLGGTLTIPPGPGRHPAVVFVAGSGPTERAYLPDLQAMLLRAGAAVLTYDKRGVAQSSGRYPGESPTEATIDTLARDAVAAARFLSRQPEIDPRRVGLAGHSQAGWVMPLAATREPAIRFIVSFSGPAVTTDEVDLFQTLTGQGERHLHSLADANREVVAAGPGGVDPSPWLESLEIPTLWLYGALDQHVPSELSAARLERLGDPNATIVLLPRANHALVETPTGLNAEMLRSNRFARALPATLGRWLAARGITRPA
ncbi:MAG: alpha/beta fold hydrolase [Gaiellales bacterium]